MTSDEVDDQEREEQRARKRPEPGELDEVKSDFAALVVAHPVGAVAAAVGVGYVLGGGVFTRLTSGVLRLALRLGMQFAVLPVLEQEVATLMGSDKTSNGAGPPSESGRVPS